MTSFAVDRPLRATGTRRGIWMPGTPVILAVLAGELSLVPTLLPRTPWIQGVFTGVVIVHAYATFVLLAWLVRAVRRRLDGRIPGGLSRVGGRHAVSAQPPPTWVRVGVLSVMAAGLVAALVLGERVGRQLATLSSGPPPPAWGTVEAATIGAMLAIALVGLGRGVRDLSRRALRRLAVSPMHTRIVAVVVLVAVVPVIRADTPSLPSHAAKPTAAWLAGVDERSAVRSGGVGSGVSWASIGVKGQQFLAGGPTAAEIRAVTHRRAVEPVRVYIGLGSAPDPRARAALAVQELRRTGAFDRAAIVMAVPTGSGWVNPAAPAALEYLDGGDVATVAVQYGDVPSWQEYLRGLRSARATTQALVDAVRDAVRALPPGHRVPRLVVYGESLGALAALDALSPSDDLGDAGLWVGVPAGAPAAAADLTSQVRLVHDDDPVAIWSPRLLLGPTAQWRGRWYPFVSFWQATADMAAAYDIPSGHGHRYATEFVDAWNTILPATGVVDAAPADRFEAIRRVVLAQFAGG